MAISVTTRAGKGAPLNATEHDANINNIVAAIENTTSGHDHDGTNSKKITYSSITAMTSAQLAGIISDETGSGALVFAESPTLVTPTLGVATATSINKVAITAPATSATLTISDGVTATIAAELHVEAATHVNQDLTSDASPTFAAIKLTSGAGAGKILTSDGSGNASWTDNSIQSGTITLQGQDGVTVTHNHGSTSYLVKTNVTGLGNLGRIGDIAYVKAANTVVIYNSGISGISADVEISAIA